jgi:hypothetical protein
MAGTTIGLVAPLPEFTQFGEAKLSVSCNTKPGVLGDHEIRAVPGVAGTMASVGASGTGTATGNAQKPPVTEYCPLVIGPPASGCPMVPLTAYTPPVLVPPPPSIVCQSTEN